MDGLGGSEDDCGASAPELSAETSSEPAAGASEGSEPEAPAPAAAPQLRVRPTLIAGVLSFLWPGLGQLALGRRRAAVGFALPALLLAAFAVWQVARDPLLFSASLWDESYLSLVLLCIAIFGVWRVAAVLHAMYRAAPSAPGRPTWRGPRLKQAVAVGLVAAIVLMHGAVATEAWAWYQTSVDVETNDFVDVAMATPTPIPTPTNAAPTAGATGVATASPTPTDVPTPTSSPTPYVNPNRITFLLVGIDFMSGRATGSTDTLMVVSVDTQARKAVMLSVPRDTANFPLYYGGAPLLSNFKINGLLSALYHGTVKSPDAPMTTLVKEISFLVGIPIDYSAAVDMDGFASLVDAVGGVDIVNPRAINDSVAMIVLPAGPAHLNGKMALRYVRSRENGGSDYLRASRQQQVLIAMQHKLLSGSGLSHFNTVLSIVGKTVSTDFPLKTARNYVSAGRQLKTIDTCVLGPPYSFHPDPAKTRGSWVSQLDLAKVANLSVYEFGQDSAYYGQPGVTPKGC
jgi:LCP family protein required for cell wall assembly